MLFRFKKNKISNGGFSLVEMVVVVAIFLIITGIIVANYPQFKDQSALELMAQEIAVNIRTAQVLGTGARVQGGSGQVENKSYGVHFDGSKPNTLISFIGEDRDDKVYSDGVYKELETHTLQGADITHFNGVELETNPDPDIFDITYRRPNPEASIVYKGNDTDPLDELLIQIKSKRGAERCKQIRISANGQIGVIPGFICQWNLKLMVLH